MKSLSAVAAVICASSLICTLVSTFVSESSTKKIINLVLGAFIICSLIIPVKNAFADFNLNLSQYESSDELSASYDEAYEKQVVNQTKANLEKTLEQFLEQNSIKINSCEIILSVKGDNSIIISSISIYISKEYTPYSDNISSITQQNFGVKPNVITE